MNIPSIPSIPYIRIPTEDEIIQSTQYQEKRAHYRMIHTSFLMIVIKLRKYQYVPYMTKRTLYCIRDSIESLKKKYAVSFEFLRTYQLPCTILDPLIVVVKELADLSDIINTKTIVDELINEIEWSDYDHE